MHHDLLRLQIVLIIAAILPLVLAACNNSGPPAY
jgi:hypothetical protein